MKSAKTQDDEIIELRLEIAHWNISSSAQRTVIRHQNKTISELNDLIDILRLKLQTVNNIKTEQQIRERLDQLKERNKEFTKQTMPLNNTIITMQMSELEWVLDE